VLLAEGAGCAEVIHGAGGLTFSLARPQSLTDAMTQAVGRWRAGTHRLSQPLESLGYDPSVAVHVDALLALADRVSRHG